MRSSRQERLNELIQTDLPLWESGVVFAGMDEAGRGPLMGNVVAACVVMSREPLLLYVDDSKKLSEKRREQVFEEIQKTALYIGVGEASPEEIDEINILNATKNAMRRAAEQVPAELFLIDALEGLGLKGEERARHHPRRRPVLFHRRRQHHRQSNTGPADGGMGPPVSRIRLCPKQGLRNQRTY